MPSRTSQSQILETISIPEESCSSVSNDEKTNPITGQTHDFYALSEDVTRFNIDSDQDVYVIGDIHGSWEMIRNALVNSQIMEVDTPAEKNVSITYKGSLISVTVPNLKFKENPGNKVIFVGDYIAKTTVAREQKTLGLLNDVLEQQKRLAGVVHGKEPIVAILGNHDFEAVNRVNHSGYPNEKNYQTQVKSMVDEDLLVPTYFYNGVWYSHSYLTDYDMENFHQHSVGIRFDGIQTTSDLMQIFQLSQQTNFFLKELVNSTSVDAVKNTWLGSEAEGKNANFMYAMRTVPADGVAGLNYNKFHKFPIIMGHLSDLKRKVSRVLSEGFQGIHRNQYPRRSHILCVDTSIYHSYLSGLNATYLKIRYQKNSAIPVEFQNCSVPTQ
jgi:hypothetical protein